MKLKLLSFSTIFIIIFSKSTNSQISSVLSITICEIIRNFYTKYSRNVDIIDFGGSHSELISKIMENLNNSMTLTLNKSKEPQKWTIKLKDQSILLFNNFKDFDNFNNKDLIEIEFLNPI